VLCEDIAVFANKRILVRGEATVVGVSCDIIHTLLKLTTETVALPYIEGTIMLCDNCRNGTYTQLAIHSNVKSSVHVIVQCFECGYQTIKKQNSKRLEKA